MIQVYMAMSADGYLAEPDGEFRWLDAYDGPDYGYEAFYEGVGALVMGWKTYEAVRTFDEWMYPGKPSLVLTHRSPDGEHPSEVTFMDAPVADAISWARERAEAAGKPNVWVMGGGIVVADCLDAGLVEEMHLYTMPLLLGKGIPMFPPREGRTALSLVRAEAYPNGVVGMRYRVSAWIEGRRARGTGAWMPLCSRRR